MHDIRKILASFSRFICCRRTPWLLHLRGLFFLWLLAAFTMGQVWQDRVSRKNSEGNRLYQEKNYSGALEKYVEARDGKHHERELAYNLANAFYQQKKYPEALQELQKASSKDSPSLSQKVHFNRGNVFFQMGKYPEAIESYKKALELNPSDRDAKHNLELALKKLQENPQQKNSKQQDQKQDQKQNEKQDQKQSGQDQKNQNSDQQKQQPSQPKDAQPKSPDAEPQSQQNQNNQQRKPQQAGMDPKEALRILDALNQQEKQEQRKQALKIQRQRGSGKDW
jgi:Ca-activated chloride channel homolog